MKSSHGGSFDLLCRLLDNALLPPEEREGAVRSLFPEAVDWPSLIGLSGTHLVTPLLGLALERLQLSTALDAEVRGYFAAMIEAGRRRNRALRRDLLRIASALSSRGIPVLPLKGAIRLVDDLCTDDAWRFMHDLDLLVPAARLAEAERLLEECGWRPLGDGPCDLDLHLPRMVHPEAEAVLELHGRVVPERLDALLPAEMLFERASPIRVEEVDLLLPDPADQLLHLVVHGQLVHGYLYTGRLLLRELVELVQLVHRYGCGLAENMLGHLEGAGHGLAGQVAMATAGLVLPRAATDLPAATTYARLLARRTLLQQRHEPLMATLGPLGGVVREWVAQGGTTGFLQRLTDTRYRRDLLRQWHAFRRKTSW